MKKALWLSFILVLFLYIVPSASAQAGIYFGVYGGHSTQKPGLDDVEFNTDTAFLYGVRAGVKFLMMALEAGYFQAAHNINLTDFPLLDWDGRQVDYSFFGLNVKYILSLLVFHPYLTVGYGYYSVDIHDIDKDKNRGYNIGIGAELTLGKKIALLAEAKYHRVKLDIQERKLTIGNFTLLGGLNIYF